MKSRVMIWANYRRGAAIAVPAPFDDGGPHVPWWYDRISEMAHDWASHGVTDVLFPNPLKTNAGAFKGADGYGPYDDYDIGSKVTSQFGGQPTRFGTAEQLRRAIAICRANGLNVFIDHVMHQRMGGHNGVYRYSSATGKDNGRFPKDPPCFRGNPPRVPQDPVPDVPDDFAFGDELCPINAIPHDYVAQGLIAAGDWLFRTLGIQGARLDDMKGMNTGFITRFMTSGAMKDKWFFGEYASGNRDDTNWWVDQVHGLASAFDFNFHYEMVQPMCNNAGSFFMGWLAHSGMIGNNPMKAVPFVESMDSDTNGFATIVFNKELGYALLLGGEGFPLIYIRDYLPEPDCYGLKRPIDNLLWCHYRLAHGSTIPRLANNPRVYVFERTGDPGLIVTLSNDVFNSAWNTVTVQTNFGPNVEIKDYTGHNQAHSWTNGDGQLTVGVPPAANGMGYGMWSRVGLDTTIPVHGERCTQVFFGAEDLDIGPITTQVLTVGRIWCAKNTLIEHNVEFDQNLTEHMKIIGPDGTQLTQPFHTVLEGWHTITLQALSFTDSTKVSARFWLTITYKAPQHFTLPRHQ